MNYREFVWFTEILWHTRPYLLVSHLLNMQVKNDFFTERTAALSHKLHYPEEGPQAHHPRSIGILNSNHRDP